MKTKTVASNDSFEDDNTVSDRIMEYRGYRILPQPCREGDGFWFGGYEIRKDGKTIVRRTNVFPGTFYFKAACTDSIEHAKIEIENLTPGRAG